MQQVAAMEAGPALLTVDDVSRSLRVGRSKVYELLARDPSRGGLRSVRVDGSRRVRARDLAEFVERLGAPEAA